MQTELTERREVTFAQQVARSQIAQEPLVFVMRPNPEPNQVIVQLPRQSPIPATGADRPKIGLLSLEVQGRMLRIAFEELKVLISDSLHFWRESVIMLPEPRRGEIVHGSGLQRPASKSRFASSINLSSRPALASASICRSHISSRNSSSQAPTARISSGFNLAMADSISSTVLMHKSYPTDASLAIFPHRAFVVTNGSRIVIPSKSSRCLSAS